MVQLVACMLWEHEVACSSQVFPTMYCIAKKRECEYAMSITIQLDKEYDKAEGVREYTMCCTPERKTYFGDPCIWEKNERNDN